MAGHSAAIFAVTRLDQSNFLLTDARQMGTPTFEFLNESQARLVLLGTRRREDANVPWAAERGWIAAWTISGSPSRLLIRALGGP